MERTETPPPKGAFRALLRRIRPHRGLFLAAVALGGLASVFEVFSIGLVGPLLLVSGPDGLEGVKLGPFSRLLPMLRGMEPNAQRGTIVALIVAGIALHGVAWWAAAVLREKVGSAVQADVRRSIFARLARAPMSWLQARRIGELDALILHETERIGHGAVTTIQLAMSAAMAAAYALFLVYLAPALTAVAFVFLAATALVIRALRRPIERQAQAMRAESKEVAGTIHETLASLHLLKIVGRADGAVERFDASNRRYLAAQRRQRRALDAIPPVSELCGVIVVLAILWLGSTVLPIRGDADALLLFPYVFLFYRLLPRFLATLTARASLATALPSVPAVEAFLADPSAEPLPGGEHVPARGAHRIVFEDVRFAYRDGAPVLDGLHLVLEPGKVTALVGASGGGKSTVVDLLLGLRRPTSGRITVDGVDLASFDGDAWRRRVGVVPQEPRLFDWTVRDNLLLTCPDATEDRLWAGLEAASAGFVRGLPQGLETRLGDRGTRLSGGERQRVCIARALLQEPDLVVFDEPTSQLDPESERAVATSIQRAARGRTSLVIAHRLSTVRAADRIAFLRHGRVSEMGSHDELVAKGGEYARLVRLGLDDLQGDGEAGA